MMAQREGWCVNSHTPHASNPSAHSQFQLQLGWAGLGCSA